MEIKKLGALTGEEIVNDRDYLIHFILESGVSE
jgi:hypothetical protein